MDITMHVLNDVSNGTVVLPLNLTDHLVFNKAHLVAIVHKNRKLAVAYKGVDPDAKKIVKEIFGNEFKVTEVSMPQDLCLLTWDGMSPFPEIKEEQRYERASGSV